MDQLEELVRFEAANSGLAFRGRAYAAAELDDLVRDLVALANAAVSGPRFLFLGVRDGPDRERSVPGIAEQDWSACRRMLARAAECVEPPLAIAVRALHVDGALVGMVGLRQCDEAPYLIADPGCGDLPPGSGWIRRGTRKRPLLRADLERLFAAGVASEPPAPEPRVGFAGNAPREEMTLPVLPLDALPSAEAAAKLRRLLEAKSSAREFGQTTTRISRLVHAQVFGADATYESHNVDSLRSRIEHVTEQHRVADEHYAFEIRAHALDVVVENPADRPLEHVCLRLKLPRLEGLGVAERLHPAEGAVGEAQRYPAVSTGERTIGIQAEVGTIPPSATVSAFGVPPRLWVREPAAGKTIPLDYTLYAHALREPVRGVLLIRFEGTA